MTSGDNTELTSVAKNWLPTEDQVKVNKNTEDQKHLRVKSKVHVRVITYSVHVPMWGK